MIPQELSDLIETLTADGAEVRVIEVGSNNLEAAIEAGAINNSPDYLRRFAETAMAVEAMGYERGSDEFISEMVARDLTRCPCGQPRCKHGQKYKEEAERQGKSVEADPTSEELESLESFIEDDNDDEDEDSEPSAEEIQEMITDLEQKLQEHPDMDHDFQVNPDGFACAVCGIMDNTTLLRGTVNTMLNELKDMLSLIEERDSMAWLFEATENYPSLEKFIDFLKRITVEGHDAIEHKYESDPERPGVCKHCSWVHPEAVVNARLGVSMRERIGDLIEYINTRRRPRVTVIEIHIGAPDGDGDYF